MLHTWTFSSTSSASFSIGLLLSFPFIYTPPLRFNCEFWMTFQSPPIITNYNYIIIIIITIIILYIIIIVIIVSLKGKGTTIPTTLDSTIYMATSGCIIFLLWCFQNNLASLVFWCSTSVLSLSNFRQTSYSSDGWQQSRRSGDARLSFYNLPLIVKCSNAWVRSEIYGEFLCYMVRNLKEQGDKCWCLTEPVLQ